MICCGLVLEGCAYVPYLEEATGGIPVREIVLRTKCELSDAFMAKDFETIGPRKPISRFRSSIPHHLLQARHLPSRFPTALASQRRRSSFGGKTINGWLKR